MKDLDDDLEKQMREMKDRFSGGITNNNREMMQELTEVIAKNFEQTYQLCQQLREQIDQKDKRIKELEEKLKRVN